MTKYPRPQKQFGFINDNFGKLSSVQRALLRRTDYRGATFNNGVGAKGDNDAGSAETSSNEGLQAVLTVDEIVMDWEKAEGLELNGPTYLTLELPDMALLTFTVADDHTFMFYSNTRNFIDVKGKLRKV